MNERGQCVECKKELPKRNWKFCGIRCRNKNNGKRRIGKKRQINFFCHVCGKNYTKGMSLKGKSKYCSRKCQGISKRKVGKK